MSASQEQRGDFKFNCPHCSQSLASPLDLLGSNLDCPTCGKSIVVPTSPDNGVVPSNESRPSSSLPTSDASLAVVSTDIPKILRERLIAIREKIWDLLVIAFDKKPSPAKIQRTQLERAKRKKARLIKDATLKIGTSPDATERKLFSPTHHAIETNFSVVASDTSSFSGTRWCPFCSEEIKKTAVKCKHCGEFLDTRSRTLLPPKAQIQIIKQQHGCCSWIIIIAIGIILAVVAISLG